MHFKIEVKLNSMEIPTLQVVAVLALVLLTYAAQVLYNS